MIMGDSENTRLGRGCRNSSCWVSGFLKKLSKVGNSSLVNPKTWNFKFNGIVIQEIRKSVTR
jgi:hypothetical protein